MPITQEQMDNMSLLELRNLQQERLAIIKRIEAEKAKIRQYEIDNKLFFFNHPGKGYLGAQGKWEFNPIQKELFSSNVFPNPNIKIITLTGANRISKTFSSFVCILSVIMGRYPWESEERTGWLWNALGWKPPIYIRWYGQDWEQHIKKVIEPKFDELWPASRPVDSSKNNMGVRNSWKDRYTKSTIEIMSNNQDSSVSEGGKHHLIIYDEPPKRDVRVAAARGLVDYKGREIFAMTLLKEAWVDTDVINSVLEDGSPDPSVYNINADISANIGYGITQEGVNQFAKSLTEEERKARLEGIPSYKAGLILSINPKIHRIEPFTIPSDWMVDIAIDTHPQKPHYVLFRATDPRGLKYDFLELLVNCSPKTLADQIVKLVLNYKLRVNKAIIDPSAQADTNNENSVFGHVACGLLAFGIPLFIASRDKSQGIMMLNDLLRAQNNMPSLFYFNNMPNYHRQMTNWMYGANGMPAKEDDDMPENAYRLSLLDTRYYPPSVEDKDDEDSREVDLVSAGRRRNPVTGY
jgi:hypothetical protein